MRRQDNSKTSARKMPAGEPPAEAGAVATAKRGSGPPDGLVMSCILVVSAAISTMLFVQFGLSMPASALAGAGAWLMFMLIHKQVQKSLQISQLTAELARARAGGAKPRGAQRPSAAAGLEAAAETAIDVRAPAFAAAPVQREMPMPPLARSDDAEPEMAQPDFSMPRPGLAEEVAAVLTAERNVRPPSGPLDLTDIHLQPEAPLRASPLSDAAWAEPQGPQAEAIRDQWSFRPRAEPRGAVAAGQSGSPQLQPTMTIEGDLELVQRKIKELADEVNGTSPPRPVKPVRIEAIAKGKADAMEQSIGALKAAASTMRGDRRAVDPSPAIKIAPTAEPPAASRQFGELVIPATAKRIAGSEAARDAPEVPLAPERDELPIPDFSRIDFSLSLTPEAVSPRAAAIARAIENNAIDVFLGPIVTLAAHSVTHYELSAKLRSPEGELIEAGDDDIAHLSEDLGSKFDMARLNKAAALCARMETRDKDGSLLTEFAAGSFSNRAFLESFAQVYETRPRVAEQLVLTVSQRAIDGFTPTVWQAVRDMHAFGFRFALDKIHHMGTDLTALAQCGFRFVRLDAQTLLDGVTAFDRFVSADEIYQRATLAGLSIIASNVSDPQTQTRLLEAGIMLGQGPLFGVPRLLNLDGGAHNRSAAA